MAQRTIRFPDDLEKAIQAEADRTNRKFHWIVVNHCRTIGATQNETNGTERDRAPAPPRASDRASRTVPDRTEAFRQATTRKTTP